MPYSLAAYTHVTAHQQQQLSAPPPHLSQLALAWICTFAALRLEFEIVVMKLDLPPLF